ncbi:MAG: aldo/keto reductase [Armatimonadetes bacterium]|nr:MAG: aldo/keto reductase [Armatimonadota bacterium]
MEFSRRELLRALTLGGVALTTGGAKQTTRIPKRPLGKIPHDATILGIGTAEIPDDDESLKALNLALDAGVNYLDTAPSYRAARSETVLGQVCAQRRDDFFLATKTLERSADGAYREVRESLARLQTKTIDLIQVHAVNDFDTLDEALRGAVKGLERAKREGLVRHIGITGHTRPEVILKAIESYPFESILVPVSAADHWLNDFVSGVIPEARKKRVAVIGMKALKGVERAKGKVADAEPWLRYAWSCPVDCLIVGFRRYAEVLENVRLAQQFRPMSAEQMRALEQEAKQFANTQALWWKKG